MARFSPQDIEEIVKLLIEGMTEAGFTGVKCERSPLPEASWKILDVDSQKMGYDEPIDPAQFAEESHYHRVATDQGAFGLWIEPYVTLDLEGTDVAQALLPPEIRDEPDFWDWCFIGLEEHTFEQLFSELTKGSRQP
jgi:hypothetical protein